VVAGRGVHEGAAASADADDLDLGPEHVVDQVEFEFAAAVFVHI